ncbi:unnamed protein product [Rotaria sp. Silwood1]|nr:unnamed protein product [Rotaria sp. Silwood1]
MCDRTTSLTDPTADFVLSDLLTVTEDLIDFSINVLDTIRIQSHFNDRNRRISLAMQLQDASNAQKTDFKTVENSSKPCTVPTTLKYDLSLYLDRILQACKRTKANLMLLRVSCIRSTNTTLLLVASTNVRVEQLNKKVQLLTRLVKENGGEFQTKKKKKKKSLSKTQIDENPSLFRLCRRCSKRTFLETIILCALTSFLFGWHVHEKAILISIIPLSLLAFDSREHARYFLLLSTFGGFSLFPLIFTGPEIPIKIALFVAYTTFLFYTLGEVHGDRGSTCTLPLLNQLETLSIILLIPLCLYVECFHTVLHIDRILPFLPLLLISIYCSFFIMYCWIRLHTIEAHQEDELTAVESTVKFKMTALTTDDHPNTLLDHQWISSDQAVEYWKVIKERTDNQLRDFSLLFTPTLSPGLVAKQYRYKILLVGCGKTSLIRALMGKEFSTINAQPTIGIQTTNIYWPVRVNQPNKPTYLFRLDFWDVGHTSSTRFDYIDKDSVDSLDMILFVVSAADRESFNELPTLIEQKRSQCSTSRSFVSLVFVTKFDQLAVLTENDAKEFQAKYKIPVYLFSSTYSNMRLATSYLNLIAEKLYRRDLQLTGQVLT